MDVPDIPEDIQRLAMAHVAGWGGSASSISMVAAAMLSERLAQKERDAKIEPESDVEVATNGYEDGYIEGFYDCLARYQDAIRQS
jgi:hypothetical protein